MDWFAILGLVDIEGSCCVKYTRTVGCSHQCASTSAFLIGTLVSVLSWIKCVVLPKTGIWFATSKMRLADVPDRQSLSGSSHQSSSQLRHWHQHFSLPAPPRGFIIPRTANGLSCGYIPAVLIALHSLKLIVTQSKGFPCRFFVRVRVACRKYKSFSPCSMLNCPNTEHFAFRDWLENSADLPQVQWRNAGVHASNTSESTQVTGCLKKPNHNRNILHTEPA